MKYHPRLEAVSEQYDKKMNTSLYICNWWRLHSTLFDVDIDNLVLESNHEHSKSTIIRFYCKKYPKHFFLKYPEFIVKKCKKLKHNTIEDTYNKLRLPDISSRQPSDVRRFLMCDCITPAILAYVGW